METSSHADEAGQSLRLVGQVFRSFARLVDAPLREQGFAMSQLPVLVSLKKGEALSQGELARIAQVEQPSMAQLLNRMERDGLVRRVPDPADGRSRLVSLTPGASRRLPQARGVMEQASQAALAGFSRDEEAQLQALLLRLHANLEKALVGREG